MKIIRSFMLVAAGIFAVTFVQAQAVKSKKVPVVETAQVPAMDQTTLQPVTLLVPADKQKAMTADAIVTPSPYTKAADRPAVNPAADAAQMKIMNGTAVMPKQLNAATVANAQSAKQPLKAKPELIKE